MRAFETGELTTRPARRRSNHDPNRFGGRFTRPRYQQTPDRAASLERRRKLLERAVMPPWMRGKLTPCEYATAALILEGHRKQGYFAMCHDQAAALMGSCSKTVQRSQNRLGPGTRGLKGLGWITVEVRERPGRKHLTNIVRIVSREWLAWIERGPKKKWEPPAGSNWEPPTGGQKCPATQRYIQQKGANVVPALALFSHDKPLHRALNRLKQGVAAVESAKPSPGGG